MALFYSEKIAKKATKTTALPRFCVQDLDYQGLGIAKLNGKTWFVENALPDEVVDAEVLEEKRHYGRAKAVKWVQKSAHRQTPFCPIYRQCGGCQMQHIPLALQREAKQRALFTRLQKLQTHAIDYQPQIVGDPQHYRRRVKLSVAFQQGKLHIGFHQAQSQAVVDVAECAVLEPALAALLPPLRSLFSAWKKPKAIGHIELVRADNGVAMLLRHIGQIGEADRALLQTFTEHHSLMLFVMTDKDDIRQWHGSTPYYRLNDLTLHFAIRDFIQINAKLNEQMVQKALEWLALTVEDRVLDLFCGMGNFTLPIAQHAKSVVGIEGVEPMVLQARSNAEHNKINNATFYQTDLDQPFFDKSWAAEPFNKVLLDPARNGAFFALDHLCQLQPERIVYISCNPATLVRDAEKLIARGYRIEKCAMIDMFPHTAHLESILLFIKAV